jgi:hypothetical protein
MRTVAAVLFLLLLVALAPTAFADDPPQVNYVSADGVYVNVGRSSGLVPGSRIAVLRDGVRIAVLEAVHVSSYSASCRVLEQTEEPRVGDAISFTRSDPPPPAPEQPALVSAGDAAEPHVDPPLRSDVRGHLAFQYMLMQDISGAGLTSHQPAVNARLVVSNLMGSSATLYFRHRSRMYYRPGFESTAWVHRLSELAVRFGDPRRITWGIGRMVVNDVYGLGYIDGAFASVAISPKYRAGLVLGLDPDPYDGGVRPGYRKFGTYLSWQGGSSARHRLGLTGAISGSYVDGTVNREYGYLQGVYTYGSALYLYQSVEVDFNRQWREEANGGRYTFSNFLTTVSARPWQSVSVDFTYDDRQQVRDYDTFETPDSLFDDNRYNGWRAGVAVTLVPKLRLRLTGGIRYRDSSSETNRFYTVIATVRHFPLQSQHLALRWTTSETPFVTAHRPTATFRFPAGRRLRLKAGVGAYLYEQGFVETDTWFIEGGAHYPLGSRYYISGDVRQFSGGNLESFQLFAEVGLTL